MDQKQEVDLNLRHYVGHHSDVIRDVKLRINNYLKQTDLSCGTREVYSAIYNALTYYQNISELSIPGETSYKTFLDNTIEEFNKDFEYLSKKYNSEDPTVPRVIQAKGRVKSPISAMGKILEKTAEYIRDGMKLTDLNNSLRDFIGLRIIVDPPQEIKQLGKQAESDFCYLVFHDLLDHRGILRQTKNEDSLDTDYQFISVNTVHDPNKQQKLKERPKKEGYIYDPESLGIFIPKERPECLEQYDDFFKDYRMFPKAKLYQRLHTCARPYYEKFIPKTITPNYIVPSTAYGPSIEYQVCTLEEEDFAEHGKASHTDYKGERKFHRLGIPLFMKFDENINKIRLTRLDEAIKEFYGYTFESMFNIDYQTFLRTFDVSQRDDILAGNLDINYDEKTGEYTLDSSSTPIAVSASQPMPYIQNLLKNTSEENLRRFYEKNGILDGTIHSSKTSPNTSKQLKLYSVEKVEELEKNEKELDSSQNEFEEEEYE